MDKNNNKIKMLVSEKKEWLDEFVLSKGLIFRKRTRVKILFGTMKCQAITKVLQGLYGLNNLETNL